MAWHYQYKEDSSGDILNSFKLMVQYGADVYNLPEKITRDYDHAKDGLERNSSDFLALYFNS